MRLHLSEEGTTALSVLHSLGAGQVTQEDLISAALILLLRVNNLEVGECTPLMHTGSDSDTRVLRLEKL